MVASVAVHRREFGTSRSTSTSTSTPKGVRRWSSVVLVCLLLVLPACSEAGSTGVSAADEDGNSPVDDGSSDSLEEAVAANPIYQGVVGEASERFVPVMGNTESIPDELEESLEMVPIHTPAGAQIISFDLRIGNVAAFGESDWIFEREISFYTSEQDMDKLAKDLQDSIVANAGWSEREIQSADAETFVVGEGDIFLQVRAINSSSGDDEELAIRIEKKGDKDATVRFSQSRDLEDSEVEAILSEFTGWETDIPFPEGGKISDFQVRIGSPLVHSDDVRVPPEAIRILPAMLIRKDYQGSLDDAESVERIERLVAESRFEVESDPDAERVVKIADSGAHFTVFNRPDDDANTVSFNTAHFF